MQVAKGATVSLSAFRRPWWKLCDSRRATTLRFTLPAPVGSALRGSQDVKIF
jgi:hypothetical protein